MWIPTHVASDWAPYRYGRWAWVEPYGWTWIDDAPWGFAPFHYGRWAYVRNRWVWAPGVFAAAPCTRRHSSSFVGGSNFRGGSCDGDRGDVAWFPLAPREIYRPAYRASDRLRSRRERHQRACHEHQRDERERHQHPLSQSARRRGDDGGVAGPVRGLARIGRRAVVVPVNDARSAHVVGDGAPVTPTQQSVVIRRQGATQVKTPPEATQTRQVVWKNTPPPRPATFASHAAQLTTTGDKPVAPLPISQTRGAPRSGVTRECRTLMRTRRRTTTARPVPNVRPNINVRSQPNDESRPAPAPQPNVNVRPRRRARSTRRVPEQKPNVNVRPAPAEQPNENARPAPAAQPSESTRRCQNSAKENARPAPAAKPDVNVRPAPAEQPKENARPAPAPKPNVNERPTPAAQPNQNERPAPPNTRAVPRAEQQPPRAAPQDEKKSPAQGEKPQEKPQEKKAPPARGQSDKGAPAEKRRDTTSDKQNSKPPHATTGRRDATNRGSRYAKRNGRISSPFERIRPFVVRLASADARQPMLWMIPPSARSDAPFVTADSGLAT